MVSLNGLEKVKNWVFAGKEAGFWGKGRVCGLDSAAPPLERRAMWFVRKILGHCLFFFWLAVTSPPILLLVWLRQSHLDSAARVSWLAVPLVLVWLGGGVWLAMTTSHYMFEENYMFVRAA